VSCFVKFSGDSSFFLNMAGDMCMIEAALIATSSGARGGLGALSPRET